jgi:hypothetical protein
MQFGKGMGKAGNPEFGIMNKTSSRPTDRCRLTADLCQLICLG